MHNYYTTLSSSPQIKHSQTLNNYTLPEQPQQVFNLECPDYQTKFKCQLLSFPLVVSPANDAGVQIKAVPF